MTTKIYNFIFMYKSPTTNSLKNKVLTFFLSFIKNTHGCFKQNNKCLCLKHNFPVQSSVFIKKA